MQRPQKINFKTNLKILEIRTILVVGVFRRFVESFPTVFHNIFQYSAQKQSCGQNNLIRNVTMWMSK